MNQVASFMTVWTKLQPEYAGNLWNEALNKRLGTKVYLNLFYVKCFPVAVIYFTWVFITFGLMHNLIP
jgi:hypothetical protein